MRKIMLSRLICLLLIVLTTTCSYKNDDDNTESTNKHVVETYPLFDWYQLTPPNWDAMALLQGIDLSNIADDDPRAFELLKDVREQWNNAPVNQSLHGQRMTINGYVVPLEGDINNVKSFLLVPYFGACIHTPPPPSNQIIHVRVTGEGLSLNNWDAFVSVSGSLNIGQVDSEFGVASYHMQADTIKPIAEVVL